MRFIGMDVGRPGGDQTVGWRRKYGPGDYRGQGYPVSGGGPRPAAYLTEAARERAFRRADRWVRPTEWRPERDALKMPLWMSRNLDARRVR